MANEDEIDEYVKMQVQKLGLQAGGFAVLGIFASAIRWLRGKEN
jgi:hypothetical protein